ncbi:MAG: hypothetical protein KC800_32370, partial [Candidatus Eremiobacteraeota bacterium]|nr:hypothetical protein [Candidatus Eremiobacteraeota bacterium]
MVFILCFTGCRENSPPDPSSTARPPDHSESDTAKHTPEPPPTLRCELQEKGVRIELPWEGGKLYRSYSYIRLGPRENRCEIPVEGVSATDDGVPDGVEVHYLAQKEGEADLRAQIEVPNRPLPALS